MKRFALVGAAGYIAPRHMRAIIETENELVSAYDPNDSVGIIDSISPESHFFTNFERFYEHAWDLRRNPSRSIDYFVVASPNHLHRAHIAAGLRLGADVICEKPLVPTVSDLKVLKDLEVETGRRVYNVLQLRHHDAIQTLKAEVNADQRQRAFDVELTYITSRGRWYHESWKGDPLKSFGISTNIGIHFFDMLHYVFGDLVDVELHMSTPQKAAGHLRYERANVSWFLSTDANDLPDIVRGAKSTYRSVKLEGTELEFSQGFTDLHTTTYQEILRGDGFGIEDARSSVSVTEMLRTMTPIAPSTGALHPYAKHLIGDQHL